MQRSQWRLLADDWGPGAIASWLHNGVAAILPMDATGDEIVGAIEAVMKGTRLGLIWL
ncbi:hypothetical protein [Argonema antarcticum]|uniref:hypothetical protein n=1 Tax=Argonema antarcticum TaxID=2942763 RepID=UPI002013BCCE|nr:hypothetical protein [Argonema antarcticum]MCL1475929.1 hypothetical protein [Argonema antarcticum A004/B2]